MLIKMFIAVIKNTRNFIFPLLLLFSFVSCKTTEPLKESPKKETILEEQPEIWHAIPELSGLSVRYILKVNDTLYLSGVEENKNYKGIVYKTGNGKEWIKLKDFYKAVGPIAVNGDSLYILSDSLYKYTIPTGSWKGICQPAPLNSDVKAVSEMIFLNNELYAMQTYFTNVIATYKIHFDGSIEDLPVYKGRSYGGAKFIKNNASDNWCYVRGQYHCAGFFKFEGNVFTKLDSGLTKEEWSSPPAHSAAMRNDTLFAGFKYPAVIKMYTDSRWQNYTDTLPHSQSAFLFKPPIKTETTTIAFFENRMFAGTQAIGVLEWIPGKGWKPISEGLIRDETASQGIKDLFRPVVFLETIGEKLLAAYGEPGYAPWGRTGVYIYNLYRKEREAVQ